MDIKKQISDHIDLLAEEMKNDLALLVSVPSVKGDAEDGCPFGKEPARALSAMLELCGKYGFETRNIENAIGYADFFAGEEPYLGMLSHMDVVPAGDGWNTNPFELVFEDGMLYGRGTSDDKGPAIAALYAMRAVKELGLPVSKNVRFIIGSDEECGSKDLPYYFDREKTPELSFSPDAEFPLINTEKGRFAPCFEITVNDGDTAKKIVSMESGNAVNAVPNKASIVLKGFDKETIIDAAKKTEEKTETEIDIGYEEDMITVTVNGKAAHASTPETGINALTAAIAFAAEITDENSEERAAFIRLKEFFPHGKTGGDGLGVEREDEMSGKLTLTLDKLIYDGKKLTAWFDSRLPVSADHENTVLPIKEQLEGAGFTFRSMDVTPVHHVDENSAFVRTLLEAYEAFSGRKGECIAIGGGTYVHDIENGVAFGSIMPDVDTHMHGANEFMPFEDLITAAKIYAYAITEICK